MWDIIMGGLRRSCSPVLMGWRPRLRGSAGLAAALLLALALGAGQGLGAPTAITSRRMTLDEARRRIGAAVYEPRDPATPVWLVVIRGRVLMSES